MTDIAPTALAVRPLAANIGAEIEGVDLARPLTDDQVDAVNAALDRWRVVFFRGQDIGHAEQIAFGRRFGELTYAHPHDDAPPDGFPEIYTVDARRFEARTGQRLARRRQYSLFGGWHSDVTPAVNPPSASILRAEIVPEYGGDTTFTNLVAAYEGLSEPLKGLVDGLWAEHVYGANPLGAPQPPDGPYRARIRENRLVAHHPVVRVHPRTGEKALYVNPVFTDRILGVSADDSRWLLEKLFHEMTRPQYQIRFRWAPGSVAFWDNRATAHLGPTDIDESTVERVLHRVTLIGEVPVGPSGEASRLVEGTPFRSAPVFAPVSPN